jgi:hypothetical protein
MFIAKLKNIYKALNKSKKIISVTVRHIIMALPPFVVSRVGRGLWNEISKELVTTRLTKYSKTAFAV